MQLPTTSIRPSADTRLSFARVALLLITMAMGFGSAFAFQHKCSLGAKWFEDNTIWGFPILFAVISWVPKPLWLSVGVVAATFVALNWGIAPHYLASIHPNGEG